MRPLFLGLVDCVDALRARHVPETMGTAQPGKHHFMERMYDSNRETEVLLLSCLLDTNHEFRGVTSIARMLSKLSS